MADLMRWIALGQQMLQENPSAHYRSVLHEVLLDPITLPQPGIVGPEYGGVCLIALNPGRGTGDASARLRQQDTLLQRWRADGAPAYDAVFQQWQRDVDQWRVWQSWVQPVLAAADLKRSQIAYLNLVKVPTVRDKKPSQRLLDLDWDWTAEQLRLLAPKVLFVGGKAVAQEVMKRGRQVGAEVLVQDRARSQDGGTRAREARSLGQRIRSGL